MGKKKGKKNTAVSGTAPPEGAPGSGSGPASQDTPLAGPSREAPPSQSGSSGQGSSQKGSGEMLSQKLSSLTGQQGSPATRTQKGSQGPSSGQWHKGPQSASVGQHQKGPQGAAPGQWQKGQHSAPAGQPQRSPQGAAPGQWQKGQHSGPAGQYPKGPQGAAPGQWQKGQHSGSAGQYPKGPQGAAPGQWQKGQHSGPAGQYPKGLQGTAPGQWQKGQLSAPAGQPQKGLQDAASGQRQKGPLPGPSAQKPVQSGADLLKKKATNQPSESQSVKENVPSQAKKQIPAPLPQDQGKQGDKSSQLQLAPIPARRTPGGTHGREINVQVNLFRLDFDKLCPHIFHYSVEFVPDRPKRLLRQALEIFRKKHFRGFSVAFDGISNLYSTKPLPFDDDVKEDAIKVTNDERNSEMDFTVRIKYAQTISTSLVTKFMAGELNYFPQTAVTAIDVVLRTALSKTTYVSVARSYYIPPKEARRRYHDLGGGLEFWDGFYQSAVLNWKPFLNVDVAHKSFPKPIPLIELLQEVSGLSPNQPLSEDQKRKFRRFITTLKIRYEVPRLQNSTRVYRVNNLGESARDHIFESNGSQISIMDYYQREKGYNIRYPDLPTVQVDPSQRGIFLPMELCTMLQGQAVNRKLNQAQSGKMIKETAKKPSDRKERILNAIREAKYNSHPVIQEFGICVSNQFEHVPARVLDPPLIMYRKWASGSFFTSNRLQRWVILNLSGTQRSTLNLFKEELINQASRQGMTIAPEIEIKDIVTEGAFEPALERRLDDWKNQNVELVLVVLPASGDFYSKVKKIAELKVGILTQCVKSETLENEGGFSFICTNIVKKMNAKTNGMNHKLDGDGEVRPWPRVLASVFEKPVMFVGIDVTHPSPDQKDKPSVAAISASHDVTALFQYNMVWRLQPPHVEIIQDLKNVMKEQLKMFYRRTNGLKPHRIIVYRDGVSDGQFQQVLTHELSAIRTACKELQKDDYKPGVSFLVVQKRHHVRFFPTNDRDADHKGNVRPGTIVDTEITHPREFDFYLASHASLQGTLRPTKYHLLWNDNEDEISEDDFEVLTFYLCHLFARCTGSVSYPAPTYYAHLAAARARVYLEKNPVDPNNPAALQRLQEIVRINPDFHKASPMFFV